MKSCNNIILIVSAWKMKFCDNEESEPLFVTMDGSSEMQETNSNFKVEKTIETETKSPCNTVKGFAYALLASIIFTVNGTLVKYYQLDVVDTISLRSVFQIFALGLTMKLKGSYGSN